MHVDDTVKVITQNTSSCSPPFSLALRSSFQCSSSPEVDSCSRLQAGVRVVVMTRFQSLSVSYDELKSLEWNGTKRNGTERNGTE